MSGGNDFWSRRQAAVRAEEEAVAAAEAETAIETERAALEEREDAEILSELNLPDPDNLKPGDDVSAFMAKVVPDRLRRRALRQLWKLNPVLANVDGLVDYGEDFTDSATVIEDLQTTYQVGKGMLAHVQEMARQAAAAEEEDEDTPNETPAPEAPVTEETPEVALAATPEPEPVSEPQQINQDETDTDESMRPTAGLSRRMRFAFEDVPDKLNSTTGTT